MAILPGAQRLYQQHGVSPGGVRLASPAADLGAGGLEAEAGRILKDASPLAGLLAEGYKEAQTAKVDDELLQVNAEFSKWRAEYEQKNQGRNAANAAADFTAKHEELAAQALQRLDGNHDEIFENLLQKRLDEGGLQALKAGLQFQTHQDQVWKKSQWEAQVAAFELFAQENAADPEAVARERAALIGSFEAKNPGLDSGAFIAKLDEKTAKSRFETLLLQENYPAAQAVLNSNAARDPRLYRGGQINEDLNNPLNLKKPGSSGNTREAYQFFASPEDGYRGAARQLSIYKRRGLVTPTQIISTWAPKSENDTEAYIAQVCAQTGFAPDQKLDVDDPDQCAKLLQAMGVKEGRLGTRYSVAQIRQALTENEGVARTVKLSELGQPGALFRAQAQAKLNAALEAKRRAAEAELRKNDWRIRQAVDDWLTKAQRGIVSDQPVSEADVLRAFGEKGEETLAKIAAAGAYGVDINSIHSMTPAEQAKLLEQRKPAEATPYYAEAVAGYDNLARAISQDQKARAEDAAAYAVRYDPEAGQARAQFLASPGPETMQTYLSALGQARAKLELPGQELLPKEDAQALGQLIDNADNPAAELAKFAEMAGPAWPKLNAEISAKLSDLTLSLTAGVPDDAAKLVLSARKTPKFREQTLAMLAGPLDKPKDISDKLEAELKEELAEFNKSMLYAGCAAQAEGIYRSAFDLALQYMATRGLPGEEAAKLAARQMAAGRYVYGKSETGATWRAPKEYEASEIEEGANRFLKEIPLDDLALEWLPQADRTLASETYRKILRRQTDWIVNSDESGFWFYVQGKRILKKDGQPLELKFTEMAKLARDKAAKVAEATASLEEDY